MSRGFDWDRARARAKERAKGAPPRELPKEKPVHPNSTAARIWKRKSWRSST